MRARESNATCRVDVLEQSVFGWLPIAIMVTTSTGRSTVRRKCAAAWRSNSKRGCTLPETSKSMASSNSASPGSPILAIGTDPPFSHTSKSPIWRSVTIAPVSSVTETGTSTNAAFTRIVGSWPLAGEWRIPVPRAQDASHIHRQSMRRLAPAMTQISHDLPSMSIAVGHHSQQWTFWHGANMLCHLAGSVMSAPPKPSGRNRSDSDFYSGIVCRYLFRSAERQ